MKTTLIIRMLLVLSLMGGLCSCSSTTKRSEKELAELRSDLDYINLKSEIEKLNNQGLSIQNIGQIKSLQLIDDVCSYDIDVAPQLKNLTKLKDYSKAIREAIILGFAKESTNSGLSFSFVKLGISCKYTVKKGDESLEFTLSPSDIKDALETKKDKKLYNRILENDVLFTNLTLPIEIDQVTTYVKMEITDESTIFIYSINENYTDMETIDQNRQELRNYMMEMFTNVPLMKSFLFSCKKTNRKLIFKYVGSNTKKEIQLDFYPDRII